MKRVSIPNVAITALIAFIAVAGLYLERSTITHAQQEQADQTDKEKRNPRANQREHVPYMFLFKHLSKIKDKEGEINELRRKSGMNAGEFKQLIDAAERYDQEVSAYDARAKEIIDDFHKIYPPGKLPVGTGPGRPPQELIELQERRNQAAINHRNELRGPLGDDGYARIGRFVESQFRPKIARRNGITVNPSTETEGK